MDSIVDLLYQVKDFLNPKFLIDYMLGLLGGYVYFGLWFVVFAGSNRRVLRTGDLSAEKQRQCDDGETGELSIHGDLLLRTTRLKGASVARASSGESRFGPL